MRSIILVTIVYLILNELLITKHCNTTNYSSNSASPWLSITSFLLFLHVLICTKQSSSSSSLFVVSFKGGAFACLASGASPCFEGGPSSSLEGGASSSLEGGASLCFEGGASSSLEGGASPCFEGGASSSLGGASPCFSGVANIFFWPPLFKM